LHAADAWGVVGEVHDAPVFLTVSIGDVAAVIGFESVGEKLSG
jgi:hypothetical protein